MDTENQQTIIETHEERRLRRGTRPWFILNLILFPVPAHFTLLRVREFSLTRSVLHLGVTFFLFFILLASALFQVIFPDINRLWMIFPIVSGFIVVFSNRSLLPQFQPFKITPVHRKHVISLLVLLFFFTLLNILPNLDLIEFQDKSMVASTSWLEELPLWQDSLIVIVGTLVVFLGYISNAPSTFSINRVVILYSCFMAFTFQIYLIVTVAFAWLRIKGGFGSEFLCVLLGAILTWDYWDAKSFGQYTRRYFLLTCTKGLSFIFIWLCFLGLPQKMGSTYASYYYRHVKPVPLKIPYDNLIFTDRDRFRSGHEAARRLRTLYAKAFLTNQPDMLEEVRQILNGKENIISPAANDIGQLYNLVANKKLKPRSFAKEDVPFFRPAHPAWDVFLTALIKQGTISESEIDRIISGFKTMLPKSSKGRLPSLDTPYDTHFVALATGTHVDFIPPSFENAEIILENNFVPVLSIRLAGKTFWGALLCLDRESGIAWFRIESDQDTEKSIQTLFDSHESRDFKEHILSHQLVSLPLEYFSSLVGHYSDPIIVVSKKGLNSVLPDKFSVKTLQNIKKALAFTRHPQEMLEESSGSKRTIPLPGYAGYIEAVARLEFLIKPRELNSNLFPNPGRMHANESWPSRFKQAKAILQEAEPLRDRDRFHLAYVLAANNNVYTDPALFIRLTMKRPVSDDLVDCRESFLIGRQLFLLGHYEKALPYLELFLV